MKKYDGCTVAPGWLWIDDLDAGKGRGKGIQEEGSGRSP